MTRGASDPLERPLAVPDGGLNLRISGNDAAGHAHGRLEDRGRRDVGPSQLVRESVAVRIRVDPESFGGLDPVMVVHRVIGELSNRDDGAGLVEGPKDQAGRMGGVGRRDARSRKADHARGVPGAVRAKSERPE